jgi:hypothetical protein
LENQIHNSMKSLHLTKLIKGGNPESEQKISKICTNIEKNIKSSCDEQIKKNVNKKFENIFKIPKNVLLHPDRLHINEEMMVNIQELEKECDELTKLYKEVSLKKNNLIIACYPAWLQYLSERSFHQFARERD